MPEGDTIHRAARTLQRVLGGKLVTRFESVYPAVTRVAEDHPVVGRTIQSVTARGKHLLIAFSDDLVLHTHMRMNGSWHIYPAGARWQRPSHEMRVLVGTADAVAVGFDVPVAELLTGRGLARHRILSTLGPDLAVPDTNPDVIAQRLRSGRTRPVAEVLLDQRIVAGIGNVLKSEILFLAGIDPFTRVASLGGADLERIAAVAVEQLRANVMTSAQTLTPFSGRRTTRSLNPNEKLWVYGRGGRPCRRCGTTIESKKTGLDARLTYWCPVCQPRRTVTNE
jgi:endonuclease-8